MLSLWQELSSMMRRPLRSRQQQLQVRQLPPLLPRPLLHRLSLLKISRIRKSDSSKHSSSSEMSLTQCSFSLNGQSSFKLSPKSLISSIDFSPSRSNPLTTRSRSLANTLNGPTNSKLKSQERSPIRKGRRKC